MAGLYHGTGPTASRIRAAAGGMSGVVRASRVTGGEASSEAALPSLRRRRWYSTAWPIAHLIPKARGTAAIWASLALAAVVAGCSTSTLAEVRARDPEFRFPGVPASRHFEVARCIRDVLEGAGEESTLLQEIQRDPDGMHVIGRPDETPSAAVFDVAIREDAVVAKMAPAPLIPRDALRDAITACVGTKEEAPR